MALFGNSEQKKRLAELELENNRLNEVIAQLKDEVSTQRAELESLRGSANSEAQLDSFMRYENENLKSAIWRNPLMQQNTH
jgi:predicted nuclease with TOPRIM domain